MMILFRTKILAVLLYLPFFVFAADDTAFKDCIQSDLSAGKITQVQALAHQLTALKDRSLLPQEYRSFAPLFTRMGTAIRAEAKAILPKLSQKDQQMLIPLLSRPTSSQLPEFMKSPKGRFKIHYALSGVDAAEPGFIEEIAKLFDFVYEFEIDELGYNAPPADFGVDGPEYDVYVHNISDYGYTTYEEPIEETPWQDYTSYIEMDNNFAHTPTKGLDGARVTAAHEFFHMIQFGYRSYQTSELNSIFLNESCSVWMEDVVFDDINDYYFSL